MKTIKLPYTTDNKTLEIIRMLQIEFSPIIRSAYCRFMDGNKELEVRNYLKTIFTNKDSWLLQSSIYDAKGMSIVDKNHNRSRIFGGKLNFIKRCKNQITKIEYQEKRLLPINSVGEASKNGNRKYQFDIDNNRIIFKLSKNQHIILDLPKLHKKRKSQLILLQSRMKNKEIPVTIKLDTKFVYISFEENVVETIFNKNIWAGIDVNPNNIGIVIYKKKKLIFSKIYDLKNLTMKSYEKSSSNKSKYLTNKLHHELREISHDIVKSCNYYQVSCFSIEDLNIKNKNHNKGSEFNRLVNNKWPRAQFLSLLSNLLNKIGVLVQKVNCAYSSYFGNLLNRKLPDPLAAATEIGRRGIYAVNHNSIFQPVAFHNDLVPNQWKEQVLVSEINSWKELWNYFKNTKVKYRIPIPSVGFSEFICKRSKVKTLQLRIPYHIL